MGTLKVTGLAKSFGIDELFKDVSFEVTRGDKVGFVGANGAGKSTLMRCLMGQEEVDAGEIRWDTNDTIGYVEQTAAFHGGTLYEEFRSAFDDIIALGAKKAALEQELKRAQDEETLAAYSRTLNRFESLGGYDYESRLRRVAFGLGFTEEDFKKDVEHFSGGQKTRICLAKALMREPDFLFLDEPTNHLDIASREWIEDALSDYTQALLFVSHDRYFIEKFATRIWLLENGTITDYRGTYEQFREYRARQTALQQTAKAVERKKEPKPKPKRAPNTTRARERTEREIEKLEGQLAALDAESEANATDYQKLMEIDARKQALNAQLEALYEAWEALCE